MTKQIGWTKPTLAVGRRWLATGSITALILLAACGGGSGSAPATSSTPGTTGSSPTPGTTAPVGTPPVATAPGTATNTSPGNEPVIVPSTGADLWSNPATWGGSLPPAGVAVVIPAGKKVILDVKTPVLRSLLIEGELVAADTDVDITADWILVRGNGKFQIGSESQPFTRKAVINLNGGVFSNDVAGMGTKFLGAAGGTLALHGAPKLSWTKLSTTAAKGATRITLAEDPAGWKVGDRIAVAPSDFDALETEQRTITAISGRTIDLDQALQASHWGEAAQRYGSLTLDMRAEVANLSRNIVIRGINNATTAIRNDSDFGKGKTEQGILGGHMMFMPGSSVKLSGIEVTQMGQQGAVGRYPVHWHLNQDASAGSYIKGSSIHNTFQRGLVIHQSNNLQVKDNVLVDIPGHAVFMEDGIERDNTFDNNLVMLVRYVSMKHRLAIIDGDGHNERQSGFWITNAANTLRNNVVAGVQNGWGFAFEDVKLDKNPVIAKDDARFGSNSLPMKEFSGNVAHSIGFNAKNIDPDRNRWPQVLSYGPEEAGSCFRFVTVPERPEVVKQSVAPTGLTAYKCQNTGFWGATQSPINQSIVADSRASIQNDNGLQTLVKLRDSVVVAMTANNPPGRTNFNGPLSFVGPIWVSAAAGGAWTRFENTRFIGNFQGDVFHPALMNAGSATGAQDFTVSLATPILQIANGQSKDISIQINRIAGFTAPIRLKPLFDKSPNMASSDPVFYLNANEVTATADATAATLRFNLQLPASGFTPPQFSYAYLPVEVSGGGITKIIQIPVDLSYLVVSRPGVNVGLDADRDVFSAPLVAGGQGIQSLQATMNDGNPSTWGYAGSWDMPVRDQPWIEMDLGLPHAIAQIRLHDAAGLSAQLPYGSPSGVRDFCVLVSNFLFDHTVLERTLTLDQALSDPNVWSQCFVGPMGKPTVVNLPAGTTGSKIRVWMRGRAAMSLAEIEVVGR
jgi:hypothetical protein